MSIYTTFTIPTSLVILALHKFIMISKICRKFSSFVLSRYSPRVCIRLCTRYLPLISLGTILIRHHSYMSGFTASEAGSHPTELCSYSFQLILGSNLSLALAKTGLNKFTSHTLNNMLPVASFTTLIQVCREHTPILSIANQNDRQFLSSNTRTAIIHIA